MVPQHYEPPEERRRPRSLAIPSDQVIEYAPAEPEMSASRILEMLRRHRRRLVGWAFAGAVAAALLALAQKPLYTGRSMLEIQPVNDRFMNLSEMVPGGATTTSEPYMDTQIRVLESDSLLERTLDKVNPTGERAKDFIGGWRFTQPKGTRSAAREWARKHLSIRAAGQSHVVEVSFEAANPRMAAEFVNTLSQQYLDMSVERRQRLIQATAQLFSQQLADMKNNLDHSVAALEDFTRQSGILTAGENDVTSNLEQTKLATLQEALGRAHEERVLEQARYERVMAPANTTDLPETADDEVLRSYEVKLAELQAQQAELSATLTPEHYKSREVSAQLEQMKAAVTRRKQEIQSRAKATLSAAQQREQTLQREYMKEASLIPGASSNAVKYRVLSAEVQTNRRLYEEMLGKVREAAAASGMRSSNIQVVDSAEVPNAPARPSIPLYTGSGLLAGLMIGVAGILMTRTERLAIEDPEQLASNVHLPVLGAIPDTSLKKLAGPRRNAPPPELMVWKQNGSLVTESFRNAFASVLLSDDAPHMLALTSALPSEGKTTVAVNLAVLYARSHRRVLLIDGDLRKPRLHEIFGIPNQAGLSTLLAAVSRQEPVDVADLAIETEIPGLYLIPAGPEAANVSHLLYSRATQRLLRRLRGDFDTVLIDTPPVSVSDARGLAKLADGVVLVIRAHRTPSQIASAAAQRLSEDGARVLGTVLNHWNPGKSTNAYGTYVYGYYGNGA